MPASVISIYFIPSDDGSEKFSSVYLGSDSDIEENRQNGTFKISFSGKKWVTLDGEPLWVEVICLKKGDVVIPLYVQKRDEQDAEPVVAEQHLLILNDQKSRHSN